MSYLDPFHRLTLIRHDGRDVTYEDLDRRLHLALEAVTYIRANSGDWDVAVQAADEAHRITKTLRKAASRFHRARA